jgi:protein phosphatase
MPSFNHDTLPDPGPWVTQAVLAANQAVYEHRESTGSDMGCTLVMALFVGATATIANVGDSRAYHLTSQGMTQLTTDHSLVERLVATRQITPEEARMHPHRNVIYRVIGDRPELTVDLFERTFAPGEALLLCSDGLNNMVNDKAIWKTWNASKSPQAVCDRLVAEANQAGGKDNISVVIVQVM